MIQMQMIQLYASSTEVVCLCYAQYALSGEDKDCSYIMLLLPGKEILFYFL